MSSKSSFRLRRYTALLLKGHVQLYYGLTLLSKTHSYGFIHLDNRLNGCASALSVTEMLRCGYAIMPVLGIPGLGVFYAGDTSQPLSMTRQHDGMKKCPVANLSTGCSVTG